MEFFYAIFCGLLGFGSTATMWATAWIYAGNDHKRLYPAQRFWLHTLWVGLLGITAGFYGFTASTFPRAVEYATEDGVVHLGWLTYTTLTVAALWFFGLAIIFIVRQLRTPPHS